MITQIIQRYYPGWDPPVDNGKTWVTCLCPFHGDDTASAAVSYSLDAFNCLACPAKGDIYSIIQYMEGVTFGEAKRIAEEYASASGDRVSRSDAGLTGRGASDSPGLVPKRSTRASRKVPARVRRRPSTGL